MPLRTAYSKLLNIGINTVTRKWAGFIKVHLQHPMCDGLALLLMIEQAFTLELETGEKVIGKVEKGFKLITKARNMRLHFKGDTLCTTKALQIFKKAMTECYYKGRDIEILPITKSDVRKYFVFLTLTTKEAREDLLTYGLTFDQ